MSVMGSQLSPVGIEVICSIIHQNCLFKIYEMKTVVTGRTFACKPNDVLGKDTTVSF
jgi:hypothetical protein